MIWPKGPGPARLGVTTAGLTCWRCKRDTQVIVTVHVAHPRHDEVCFSLSWDEGGVWGDGSPVKQLLARLLTPEVRGPLNLGAIKPRFSKTVGGMYLSQGCTRCDALQGDYFIMELRHEAFYDGQARAPSVWLPFTLDQSLLQTGQEWHFLPAVPSS
ncbi:hypothetical protein [Deinococcus carri]|uniref:hypothetical protein n=1 Tax=Deinococcus carri TaxID=1211323 RepID=UPI0031EBD7BC